MSILYLKVCASVLHLSINETVCIVLFTVSFQFLEGNIMLSLFFLNNPPPLQRKSGNSRINTELHAVLYNKVHICIYIFEDIQGSIFFYHFMYF